MRHALASLFVLGWTLAMGCAPSPSDSASKGTEAAGSSAPTRTDPEPLAEPEAASAFGRGFLVWESNRTRDWRIWTRALATAAPRQLTADQPGRQHCCPHISPDGAWIAYLSVADGKPGYAKGGSRGALRLIRPDGTGDRLVAASARSSWENRAVVWRSSSELIFIRGDGATALHDLDSAGTRVLATPAQKSWLVNSRLTHAVSGVADFSEYLTGASEGGSVGGSIAERTARGGCQPYFSHDGRWGFWAAGAGGPIHRVELATGEVSTILKKGDPRLPDDLGYAYFPMFSRDGRLFALAASNGDHDHFAADYEVFVARSDPETLEIVGDAVRMTRHPATDRYPDVFLEPLALGSFRGEAPLTVEFPSRQEGPVLEWSFGDGATRSGRSARHTFEQPGRYEIEAAAEGSDTPLRGEVLVLPARPPRPERVLLSREGRLVTVTFDEGISVEDASVRFESETPVTSWKLAASATSLEIVPAERIDGFDRLLIEGVTDRAERPNPMEPSWLEIEPPLWPSDRRGLAFLWQTANAPNLVADPELEAERSVSLTASGRALVDRHFAMSLDGGYFAASSAWSRSIVEASRKSNEVSFEVVVTPMPATKAGRRSLVAFSGGSPRNTNFQLWQESDRLMAALGTNEGARPIEIAAIPDDEPSHVLVSYRVGDLAVYLNGSAVVRSDSLQGDFFQWKPRPLLFGNSVNGNETWRGGLEGIAIYNRFIEEAEARENHLRYQRRLRERPSAERLVVDAVLSARSSAPDLAAISPYREALAIFEYRVKEVLEGEAPSDRLRVAHWVILDGEVLEINRKPRIGETLGLTLERFADNPQLESLYLSDTLDPAAGAGESPLYYSVAR